MVNLNVESLGFTKEEIETILNRFSCKLNVEDWESIKLFENDGALFNYLYIEDDDAKDSLTNLLMELATISEKDLRKNKSVAEYMIGYDEDRLKLPSGRWVYFTQDLVLKDRRGE
ncbi:hypothetical protein [Fictibacillus fluitans]|uniref:Uncharacterized protein n=1 Tax=Fictibacillus fluitans TaxID=3058422 RepID=A0ABT8I0B7_9BACL|nr:hypothetical protein [Fictibacillus sp. NE201]MDN4526418.1 hypothetical protein [Fictibacillus sp. NE201]